MHFNKGTITIKGVVNNERFIKVYIYDRDDIKNDYFIPAWRRKEIKEAHPFEKDDKNNIWGALTYAVKDCFGVELESLNPHKLPTGKLVIDNYHVSISHSKSKLLVVLSSQNIGADVQLNEEHVYGTLASDPGRFSKKEIEEIHEKENNKDLFVLFRMWNKKESLYKYLYPG